MVTNTYRFLTEISKRLAKIELKTINEKIEWKRYDESSIDRRIQPIIDELELSADRPSERNLKTCQTRALK